MKAILMIDEAPRVCDDCILRDTSWDYGERFCILLGKRLRSLQKRDEDCPLIPLTEYEEARINEILKEREDGTQQD